jgi:hypothetical protein
VKVDELLRQAVRASSAVEGVNSVVRMHQGRHRHVSQEMLDLKRLYWNCRVFREGKRKGWSRGMSGIHVNYFNRSDSLKNWVFPDRALTTYLFENK